jgi:deoxyadenosine/deoxycytidine kinase
VRRFIVVEGLIGVGKTSLCRLLQAAWDAELILEPSETNPFLEPYYADPERFAFPVQMFYLINRWRQQDRIRQPDMFHEVVVSDYLFAKDRLFAEMTLNPTELELYDRFAGALGEQAPVPDLVIYLEAPTATLMERIARRKAPGEHLIEPEYLDRLRARYEDLLHHWTRSPVLRLDNRELNYVDSEAGRREVLQTVEAALAGEPVPTAPGSNPDREAQPDLFGAGT